MKAPERHPRCPLGRSRPVWRAGRAPEKPCNTRPVPQIEDRLQALGLTLPRPLVPPTGREPHFAAVRVLGSRAYVSGQGPTDGSEMLVRGKVGRDLSAEEGAAAARLAGLAVMAALKEALGDLDRVARWVRAVGYVNCTPDFTETPVVVNGFSDLIIEVFGEEGRHARAAPGVTALPVGLPVVIEAEVEVE